MENDSTNGVYDNQKYMQNNMKSKENDSTNEAYNNQKYVQNSSKSKEILLSQLKELGYDTSSGRKQRSDKGTIRGPNSKTRSDKGEKRLPYASRDPVVSYQIVKTRLLSKEVSSQDDGLQLDINSIFCPVIRQNKTKNEEYFVIIHGVKKNRTVRHIKGYTVDLEKYRFEALQNAASNIPIPEEYRSIFKQEIEQTNANTWIELFCRLYHIKEEDYLLWTYEHWKNDYLIMCEEKLDNNFQFNLQYSPGSEQFMPEYAFRIGELRQEKEETLVLSKEYENVKARYRDLLLSKAEQQIRNELLSQQEFDELSKTQLDKLVRKQINKEEINSQVEDYMKNWLSNKVQDT